jgi:hypothetical protein
LERKREVRREERRSGRGGKWREGQRRGEEWMHQIDRCNYLHM